jgi:hypothetical protein
LPTESTEHGEERSRGGVRRGPEYARQPELSLSVFGLLRREADWELQAREPTRSRCFFDRIYRITGIEEGSARGETEAFDGKRVRAFGKRLMVS